MSLSPDILLDRLKLKTKANFWMFISLICFISLLFMSIKPLVGQSKTKNGEFVARINIEGLITEDLKRNKALKDISTNDDIKAVILHINSPGGTFVGSEDIFNNIRNIAAKKPVIALMGSIAASGGYMSAIAADYIIAHQGTITGSIGVIMQSFEVSELAKKIGIGVLTLRSGKYKAAPSTFEKSSEDVNKVLQNMIMDHYEVFVDMVQARRNINREELLKLADGRIYTGRQAVNNKLIDIIGDESTALNWLKEEKKLDNSIQVRNVSLRDDDNIFRKYFPKVSILDNIKSIDLTGSLALWNP